LNLCFGAGFIGLRDTYYADAACNTVVGGASLSPILVYPCDECTSLLPFSNSSFFSSCTDGETGSVDFYLGSTCSGGVVTSTDFGSETTCQPTITVEDYRMYSRSTVVSPCNICEYDFAANEACLVESVSLFDGTTCSGSPIFSGTNVLYPNNECFATPANVPVTGGTINKISTLMNCGINAITAVQVIPGNPAVINGTCTSSSGFNLAPISETCTSATIISKRLTMGNAADLCVDIGTLNCVSGSTTDSGDGSNGGNSESAVGALEATVF
jgi:hypothetical protein